MNEIWLDNTSLPVTGICDLCAAPEDFYHADRTVDFHVLIYVVQGVIYVTEEETDYEIHPGELLFLKSGIHHYGKRRIGRGTRWYFAHFYLDEKGALPAFVPDIAASHPEDPIRYRVGLPKKLTGLMGSGLERQLTELIDLYHSEDPMKRWEINGKLFSLLGRIAFWGQKPRQPKTLSESICDYLSSRMAEPFSAEKLEKAFFLSYKHMEAVFKKEKKITLQQYHNKVRMTEACRLLRTTLLPVGEIGKELGYSDMLYFSRCFHQFTGMSPTRYRREAASVY